MEKLVWKSNMTQDYLKSLPDDLLKDELVDLGYDLELLNTLDTEGLHNLVDDDLDLEGDLEDFENKVAPMIENQSLGGMVILSDGQKAIVCHGAEIYDGHYPLNYMEGELMDDGEGLYIDDFEGKKWYLYRIPEDGVELANFVNDCLPEAMEILVEECMDNEGIDDDRAYAAVLNNLPDLLSEEFELIEDSVDPEALAVNRSRVKNLLSGSIGESCTVDEGCKVEEGCNVDESISLPPLNNSDERNKLAEELAQIKNMSLESLTGLDLLATDMSDGSIEEQFPIFAKVATAYIKEIAQKDEKDNKDRINYWWWDFGNNDLRAVIKACELLIPNDKYPEGKKVVPSIVRFLSDGVDESFEDSPYVDDDDGVVRYTLKLDQDLNLDPEKWTSTRAILETAYNWLSDKGFDIDISTFKITGGNPKEGWVKVEGKENLQLESLNEDVSSGEATFWLSDEHTGANGQYYGYITITHPSLGEFIVGINKRGPITDRTKEVWEFIKTDEPDLTPEQVNWLIRHTDELKKIYKEDTPSGTISESLTEGNNQEAEDSDSYRIFCYYDSPDMTGTLNAYQHTLDDAIDMADYYIEKYGYDRAVVYGPRKTPAAVFNGIGWNRNSNEALAEASKPNEVNKDEEDDEFNRAWDDYAIAGGASKESIKDFEEKNKAKKIGEDLSPELEEQVIKICDQILANVDPEVIEYIIEEPYWSEDGILSNDDLVMLAKTEEEEKEIADMAINYLKQKIDKMVGESLVEASSYADAAAYADTYRGRLADITIYKVGDKFTTNYGTTHVTGDTVEEVKDKLEDLMNKDFKKAQGYLEDLHEDDALDDRKKAIIEEINSCQDLEEDAGEDEGEYKNPNVVNSAPITMF